jgi:hypothetical protein
MTPTEVDVTNTLLQINDDLEYAASIFNDAREYMTAEVAYVSLEGIEDIASNYFDAQSAETSAEQKEEDTRMFKETLSIWQSITQYIVRLAMDQKHLADSN